MRKFLYVALVFLSLSLSASAQADSISQMTLAGSQRFITRLQYALATYAQTVLSETLPANCSTQRRVYAQSVINDSRASAAYAAPIMTTTTNIVGTVIPNADPNLVDSSANDASILSQVATSWNALSKCGTGW